MKAPATLLAAVLLGVVLLGASAPPARAQEYSRFLRCGGHLFVGEQSQEAHVDLALRTNSRSALIEASNVLPAGEVLRYAETPGNYTLLLRLHRQGTQVLVLPGWFRTTILVHHPNLQKLNQIRMSIDRHSGALAAELLNERDTVLATLSMQCALRSSDERLPRL